MPSWIDADDERCENTQTEKNKTARGRRFRLHLAGPCSPSGAAAAVIIIVITRRTSERRSHRTRGCVVTAAAAAAADDDDKSR